MKQLFTLSLLLFSFGITAQNWTLFPYNQETYFEFKQAHNIDYSNTYYGTDGFYGTGPYYVDSISTDGDSIQHHILRKKIEEDYTGYCKESLYQQTRFSEIAFPLTEVNGIYSDGNFTFNSLAEVGDSWIAYEYTTFDGVLRSISITCDSIGPVSFLGITDNAKYFSVQYFEDGIPVVNQINDARYVLSENYGFIEFVPFNHLSIGRSRQGRLIGLESNGEFLGLKRTLDFTAFLNYEIGDVMVFSYYSEYLVGPGTGPVFDEFTQEIVEIIATDSTYQYITSDGAGETYDLEELNRWLETSYWGVGFTEEGTIGDSFHGMSLNHNGEENLTVYNLFLEENTFWTFSGYPGPGFPSDQCELNTWGCYYLRSFNTQMGYTGSNYGCEGGFVEYYDLLDYVPEGDSKFFFQLLLEGPTGDNGHYMSSDLGEQELLPINQPFNIPPYNYTGTENISEITNMTLLGNFVDWVLVEVRTGNPNLSGNKGTTTVATKAALLTSSGHLYGADGKRGVYFEDLALDEPYYLCIRHRNHLDVLSAIPQEGSVAEYNFTLSVDQAFGPSQQKLNDAGLAVLFAGDFNGDGTIQTTDYDLWQANPAQNQVYEPSDANLDGIVQTTDYDLWFSNKAKVGSVEIGFEEPLLPSINSGSIYFACDYGPYFFSLDSLLENCSTNESIINSLTSESLDNQDSTLLTCTYDYEFEQLADQNNWDFEVSRSSIGMTFELDWAEAPQEQEAINATVEGTNLGEGEYPFYNGYTVQLAENETLTLLFFNVYIGGCFHDLMVWELVSGE